MKKYSNKDLEFISGYLDGLKPEDIISVREWADKYRMLSELSARPGRYDSSVTPYVREVMERLSITDPAQKIIFKKSAQIGATEMANNWLGYIIDIAPAPMLYVMPTDTMMKDTSKSKIDKMIQTTESISKKIAPSHSRIKQNTLLYKEFKGGFVKMVGANSPVGLSSTAVKNVYLDEIDRFPNNVGGEGSAISLAEARTITFGARKKMLLTSTPKLKGTSAIDAAFEVTGQRYFHVPCPHCNVYQILTIDQLRHEPGKYDDTKYECAECKVLIEEYFKTKMLNAGKWIAKFPERENGIVYGYFINALYSPYGWYSWKDIVRERDESMNDIPRKIAFTNTILGECYEEEAGDKPDWQQLYDRAEDYEKDFVMSSVTFITAGVDVQGDRLEIEVVGWMKGKTSQSIDYIIIPGDTSGSEVWDELTKVLNRTWHRQGDNAPLSIRLMAVDAGFNTQKVYEFTRKHSITRVIPIRGRDNLDMIFAAPKITDIIKAGKKVGKVKTWQVGVSLLKSELYGLLKLRIDRETGEVPNGYCYFPKREPHYFRGLTAEEVVTVINKKNYEQYVWVKKYLKNEPLDVRIYNRAAAAIIGMDRWTDERWSRETFVYEQQAKPFVPPSQRVAKDTTVSPTTIKRTTRRQGGGFWGR